MILRTSLLLSSYRNVLKWKTIGKKQLVHKLHFVKKLFSLNEKWNLKPVITGPKMDRKIGYSVFCQPST
jgi:hypothetical protein